MSVIRKRVTQPTTQTTTSDDPEQRAITGFSPRMAAARFRITHRDTTYDPDTRTFHRADARGHLSRLDVIELRAMLDTIGVTHRGRQDATLAVLTTALPRTPESPAATCTDPATGWATRPAPDELPPPWEALSVAQIYLREQWTTDAGRTLVFCGNNYHQWTRGAWEHINASDVVTHALNWVIGQPYLTPHGQRMPYPDNDDGIIHALDRAAFFEVQPFTRLPIDPAEVSRYDRKTMP